MDYESSTDHGLQPNYPFHQPLVEDWQRKRTSSLPRNAKTRTTGGSTSLSTTGMTTLTSTSLYPPSTSSDEGPPSPASIPSLPLPPIHSMSDGKALVHDTDDLSFRLQLLVKNNYYLPPAHVKPVLRPPTPPESYFSSQERPKDKPSIGLQIPLFRKKKPAPLSPSPTPQRQHQHFSRRPRTAPTTPTAPFAPLPHHRPHGPPTPRVVVIREPLPDLLTPALPPPLPTSPRPSIQLRSFSLDPTTELDVPVLKHEPSNFSIGGMDAIAPTPDISSLLDFSNLGHVPGHAPSASGEWRKMILQSAVGLSMNEDWSASGRSRSSSSPQPFASSPNTPARTIPFPPISPLAESPRDPQLSMEMSELMFNAPSGGSSSGIVPKSSTDSKSSSGLNVSGAANGDSSGTFVTAQSGQTNGLRPRQVSRQLTPSRKRDLGQYALRMSLDSQVGDLEDGFDDDDYSALGVPLPPSTEGSGSSHGHGVLVGDDNEAEANQGEFTGRTALSFANVRESFPPPQTPDAAEGLGRVTGLDLPVAMFGRGLVVEDEDQEEFDRNIHPEVEAYDDRGEQQQHMHLQSSNDPVRAVRAAAAMSASSVSVYSLPSPSTHNNPYGSMHFNEPVHSLHSLYYEPRQPSIQTPPYGQQSFDLSIHEHEFSSPDHFNQLYEIDPDHPYNIRRDSAAFTQSIRTLSASPYDSGFGGNRGRFSFGTFGPSSAVGSLRERGPGSAMGSVHEFGSVRGVSPSPGPSPFSRGSTDDMVKVGTPERLEVPGFALPSNQPESSVSFFDAVEEGGIKAWIEEGSDDDDDEPVVEPVHVHPPPPPIPPLENKEQERGRETQTPTKRNFFRRKSKSRDRAAESKKDRKEKGKQRDRGSDDAASFVSSVSSLDRHRPKTKPSSATLMPSSYPDGAEPSSTLSPRPSTSSAPVVMSFPNRSTSSLQPSSASVSSYPWAVSQSTRPPSTPSSERFELSKDMVAQHIEAERVRIRTISLRNGSGSLHGSANGHGQC